MEERSVSRLSVFGLVLLLGVIFYSVRSHASERYLCAARVDCSAASLPSTQELPVLRTPTVMAESVDGAREKCMTTYANAFRRLERAIEGASPAAALYPSRGCTVFSEAFREAQAGANGTSRLAQGTSARSGSARSRARLPRR